MNTSKTQKLVRIALMAAILCILGPLSFPLPFSAVPVSLSILGIFLAIVILEPVDAVASIALYILLGLVGLPVFSGFTGGVAKLFGPTGGYIIGYIPLVLIAWLFVKLFNRKIVFLCAGLILGTLACYALGTTWLAISAGMTFKAALLAGVIPFIPFDIAKLAISVLIGLPVRKSLHSLL